MLNPSTKFCKIAVFDRGSAVSEFLDDAVVLVSILEGLDDMHGDKGFNVNVLEGRGKGTAFGQELLTGHGVGKFKIGEVFKGDKTVEIGVGINDLFEVMEDDKPVVVGGVVQVFVEKMFGDAAENLRADVLALEIEVMVDVVGPVDNGGEERMTFEDVEVVEEERLVVVRAIPGRELGRRISR